MKAEFELSLDSTGNPYIKFKHHDNDDSLEQKLLKVFIDGIRANGCKLISGDRHYSPSKEISYEWYFLIINVQDQRNNPFK